MKIAKSLMLVTVVLSIASCSLSARTNEANVNLTAGNSAGTTLPPLDNAVEETQNENTTTLPAAGAPEAVVKDLYAVHEQDMNKQTDRILNGKDRKYLDKYFDKNLANLLWKDLTSNSDEVGVLDFDPFYNAQDFDIKNFVVGQAKTEGTKASVPVSFTNSGRKEKLVYLLTQQNGEWKISDIKYTNGDTLLKYFKEFAQNNNSSNNASEEGNFEGTYQIGDTTATVKPIKMAFELKWAKGTGTMIFFYSGQGVLEYESEDKGKGVDKFIFEDTNFTTGKFIRGSDGKEMPVKKIK